MMRQVFVLAATAVGVFAGMYILGAHEDGVTKVLLGLVVGTAVGIAAAWYGERSWGA